MGNILKSLLRVFLTASLAGCIALVAASFVLFAPIQFNKWVALGLFVVISLILNEVITRLLKDVPNIREYINLRD